MPAPDFFVNRSKITPPKLPSHALDRDRVTELLLESFDYKLTLLLAGAGHGKSTALAAMLSSPFPIVWYQLFVNDADPFRFLLHLLHGVRKQFLPCLIHQYLISKVLNGI